MNLFKNENSGVLTHAEVKEMLDAFRAYRDAKEGFDRTVIENENWFKGKHWQYISGTAADRSGFKPSGSYLLNGMLRTERRLYPNRRLC